MIFSCPICLDDSQRGENLYGEPVCRTCHFRFANRRQMAFVIDLFLLAWLKFGFEALRVGRTDVQLNMLMSLPIVLFAFKDGFAGYSIGKRLMRVRVTDRVSGEPIGFRQSFLRNLEIILLLLGGIWISRVGSIAAFFGLLLVAHDLQSGYRSGDKAASTKVVWNRYAFRKPFTVRTDLCFYCGYDLTGNVSGICPECGKPASIPPSVSSEASR